MEIGRARLEPEIRKCFAAMRELRPHLDEASFMGQARRQVENHGYQLAFIQARGEVVSVAGYRIAEFLAWGKTLYVDDLITRESHRGKGYGGALLDWLLEQAKEAGCAQFHLDSGVQRFDAHRLYLNKRMVISAHHFARALP